MKTVGPRGWRSVAGESHMRCRRNSALRQERRIWRRPFTPKKWAQKPCPSTRWNTAPRSRFQRSGCRRAKCTFALWTTRPKLSMSTRRPSILEFVLRRIGREEDDDHAEAEDERRNRAGAAVVLVKPGRDRPRCQNAEGAQDAAKIERDTGACSSSKSGK